VRDFEALEQFVNDPTPWIIIFCVFGIFAAIMLAGVFHAQRDQELRRFAARWQGRVNVAGFFEAPGVTMKLDDVLVALDFTQHGDDPTQTHLTVPMPGAKLRLELRPQTIARQLGKYLGMQDIEIGHPEFDAAFIIQGSSPRLIQEFLTPPVQAAIMRLAHCGALTHFDLHLVISAGTLRITKHHRLTTEAQLSTFALACRDLIRAIRDESQAGIEFVAAPKQIPVEETECSVCGDPLQEKIVFCTKCKTPHHLDCWQYFGSCAVYGCGQKKYNLARPREQQSRIS
jgi:hypothetical protein